MRILEKYILNSVVKNLLGCLFIFILLYIVIDVFSNLEQIIKQKITLNLVLSYYFSYLPLIFVQVIGFAYLVSVLYTLGILNKNNEIIAMRTSGLSIFWISRSIIVLSIIISLICLWLNIQIIPETQTKIQVLKTKMQNKNIHTQKVLRNINFYGLKNRLFFVNRFNVEESSLEGIVVLEHDAEQNLIKKISAEKAIFKDGIWYFYNCHIYFFDLNGEFLREPVFSEKEIFAFPETPKDFLKQKQKPELMKLKEIKDYIWKLSRSKATSAVRNFKVELYQRLILSFNSLFLTLLGIPFALRFAKKGSTALYSLGFAIILGFIYYILTAISIALGKAGVISPLLSCIITPLITIGFGIYLILETI